MHLCPQGAPVTLGEIPGDSRQQSGGEPWALPVQPQDKGLLRLWGNQTDDSDPICLQQGLSQAQREEKTTDLSSREA